MDTKLSPRLSELPEGLVRHILMYLDTHSLSTVACVSNSMRRHSLAVLPAVRTLEERERHWRLLRQRHFKVGPSHRAHTTRSNAVV